MTHARTEFEFRIDAPRGVVAPLFGADEERRWAAGWSPRFIHPQPAADVEGAVFVIDGDDPAVWVNTIFDLDGGRVQYVNFVGGSIVTRIDITIGGDDSSTDVRVTYERTAVAADASARVEALAEGDRQKAPEWEAAIRMAVASAES